MGWWSEASMVFIGCILQGSEERETLYTTDDSGTRGLIWSTLFACKAVSLVPRVSLKCSAVNRSCTDYLLVELVAGMAACSTRNGATTQVSDSVTSELGGWVMLTFVPRPDAYTDLVSLLIQICHTWTLLIRFCPLTSACHTESVHNFQYFFSGCFKCLALIKSNQRATLKQWE